jgi:hypothetical protein
VYVYRHADDAITAHLTVNEAKALSYGIARSINRAAKAPPRATDENMAAYLNRLQEFDSELATVAALYRLAGELALRLGWVTDPIYCAQRHTMKAQQAFFETEVDWGPGAGT